MKTFRKNIILSSLVLLSLIGFGYVLFLSNNNVPVYAEDASACKAIRLVVVIDESPSFTALKQAFLDNVDADLLNPLAAAGYKVDYTLFGASGTFLDQNNYSGRNDSGITLAYDIPHGTSPCTDNYEAGVTFGGATSVCARGSSEDWGIGAYKAARMDSLWSHPDSNKFYGKKIVLALGDTLPIGNDPDNDSVDDDLFREFNTRILRVYNQLVNKLNDKGISFMGTYQAVAGEYEKKDTFDSLGLGVDDLNKYDILELMEKISSQTNGSSIDYGGNWNLLVQAISNSVQSYDCGLICGDGIKADSEACENVSPYIYSDSCGYGETNCCYTPAAGDALQCTVYSGPYCGDSILDIANNEECENGGSWYGGTGLPLNDCAVSDPPGTCKYCDLANCTVELKAEGADVPLVVSGGLVALVANTEDSSAIQLNRNIYFYSPNIGELYFEDNNEDGFNENVDPAEQIIYDPRYLDIYRNILGSFGNIQFMESGVQ